MSLNTGHANNGVLIHCGEFILLYSDNVELKFEENNDPRLKGCKKGRIYLTTHRMIFTNCNGRDPLLSFCFPFFMMTNVELEQPTFGCNYIKGKIRALTQADLHCDPFTGAAIFKLYFKSGGAVDFGLAMLQAAKMASRHANVEPPPPYVPPMAPYYVASQQTYMPPAGAFGMSLPTHVFPNAPPASGVYMTDQPPPYPGINTHGPGYQPMPSPGCNPNGMAAGADPYRPAGADAKAQEAAQTAYYDPNEPHFAWMPTAPPYSAPQNYLPSYAEATKKGQ